MAKILLVEDDKSLREIYGVRLMAEGYDIVSAGDGEEALAMAIKERPDLIVSDVMMPKISGFDMLDILRSTTETKDVKVIMMTALSSEDQRARGEALGADRYLVKSQVGIEDVVRTVHDVLGDSLPGPVAAPSFPASAPVATPAPAEPAVAPTPIPTPAPVPVPPAPIEAPVFPEPVPAPIPAAPAVAPTALASPVVQTAPAYAAPVQIPVQQMPVAPTYVAPAPVAEPAPVASPTSGQYLSAPQAPSEAFSLSQPTEPAPVQAAPAQAPVVFPPIPSAPVATPVAPTAPAPYPAPAPIGAPAPAQAPEPLPLPTAPFSTPAPASLGERVIAPLNDIAADMAKASDLSNQMSQVLSDDNTLGIPPTPDSTPTV